MSRKRVAIYVIVIFIAILIGIVADYSYQVSHHADQFSFHIRDGNASAALEELNNLKYLHEQPAKWKLGRLANFYGVFDAMTLYEATYDYLIGDYTKVINSLKNSNDYRAARLVGASKFRQKQYEYRFAKDELNKKKIIEEVLRDINPDFRRAVENSPEFDFPDPNFDDRKNYDITSDPKAAQAALESQRPGRRVILGFGPTPAEGQPKPGEPRLNEDKKPGGSPPPLRKG